MLKMHDLQECSILISHRNTYSCITPQVCSVHDWWGEARVKGGVCCCSQWGSGTFRSRPGFGCMDVNDLVAMACVYQTLQMQTLESNIVGL